MAVKLYIKSSVGLTKNASEK